MGADYIDPDQPDCLTLLAIGDHIEPEELNALSDTGYTRLVLMTTALGGIVNVILSVAKCVAGYAYHSQALIADGIHSFSDVLSDVVAAGAATMAGRPADDTYPYGYGRWESLGTLWVGLMILGATASLFMQFYEQLQAVLEGTTPFVALPALFVAAASAAVKEVTYQVTFRVGQKVNSSVLVANAWHHRSDAISSLAALAGIIGARAGFVWADAVGGAAVACFLGKVGLEVFRESVRVLGDVNLAEEVEEGVAEAAAGLQCEVHSVRARGSGRHFLVDLCITVPPSQSCEEAMRAASDLRTAIRAKCTRAREVLIQFTPAATSPKAPSSAKLAPPAKQVAAMEMA